MKRFFKKTDITALWKEDGDLQRMKEFFHTIEIDPENNEQIKQSIKQKVLEKMSRTEQEYGISPTYSSGLRIDQKESLATRIRARIPMLGNRQWKLGLSVAVIALLVIVGQDVRNGSSSIFPRMGSMEKSAQSTSMAPQAALFNGSMDTSVEADTKSKAFNDSSILPIPPDQTIVPPADKEIPRKVIHDLSLTLEVTNINDTVTLISQQVQTLQGYIISSRQSGLDNHSSAQLSAKIPADKLNVLRDLLSSWGKVLDQQLMANDITNQYYDSQTRLQVLEVEEKRYLEILSQAKNVDDVLKVENALGNVRQQIEQIKGQLKLWSHQVDYSTVTLEIVTHQSPQVNITDPWQPISWSETWKAAGDAVLKTLSSTWNGLNYLVVGIGYASPYLLICAVGWSLYRVWKKKKSQ